MWSWTQLIVLFDPDAAICASIETTHKKHNKQTENCYSSNSNDKRKEVPSDGDYFRLFNRCPFGVHRVIVTSRLTPYLAPLAFETSDRLLVGSFTLVTLLKRALQ